MNRNIMIAVGVVAVVAIGFFVFRGPAKAPTDNGQTEDQSGTFNGSFSDLAARGGNYKCTYSQVVAGSTSKGTVYVAGTKVRGDFESTVQGGGTVQTHMLRLDDFTYIWTSAAPSMGFKFASTGAMNPGGMMGQGQYDTATQKAAYSCAAWSVDTSVLIPPSSVTFTVTPQH